jgi:hypothetical protein
VTLDYHRKSWLGSASTVVFNFPFSVIIHRDNFSRTTHIPASNGGKGKATRTDQPGMYSAVLHTHSHSFLARPSLSGAKYPIPLACLQYPQNLRKPMESSVPSSELPSKCPVVILILKTTNLTTKTLASLNNSEQGPRFCRL